MNPARSLIVGIIFVPLSCLTVFGYEGSGYDPSPIMLDTLENAVGTCSTGIAVVYEDFAWENEAKSSEMRETPAWSRAYYCVSKDHGEAHMRATVQKPVPKRFRNSDEPMLEDGNVVALSVGRCFIRVTITTIIVPAKGLEELRQHVLGQLGAGAYLLDACR